MRLIMAFVFIIAVNSPGRAQYGMVQTTRQASQSICLQAGTMGAGLFYNHVVSHSHRLTARVGGQYIAYRKPIRLKTAPASYLTVDPDFMISTGQAGLVWNPFRRGTFFIAAGVGYTWHPNMSFVITANDKLNLGGLELTPEDVGTVNLGVRWHPVVGYVGWGFGRVIPRRRFGLGFEMGMYYLGRPTVQLSYEGFLETTNLDEQVPIVERNLSNYRYLPSLSLTLSYALNRSH
ncbi:MAG: hypothetical protein JWP57_1845 [Spirosoma sp.]|nr:hypothetical protein [Spirosoma sp.]